MVFMFNQLSLAAIAFLIFHVRVQTAQLQNFLSRDSPRNPLVQIIESIEADYANKTGSPRAIQTRGIGLNGELCQSQGDCSSPRKCITASTTGVAMCSENSLACVCMDMNITGCTSRTVCPTGERCTQVSKGPPKVTVCFSSNMADRLKLAEAGSCIDARALEHFEREDLVFEEDRIAEVYCDQHESCATGGHMIVFKEKAMMMMSYCQIVRCDKKKIKVNSPKYHRGLRLKSNTDGLEYTAFAAQFETRIEEFAMSKAIRAGF